MRGRGIEHGAGMPMATGGVTPSWRKSQCASETFSPL
jgi:hypothetical protein